VKVRQLILIKHSLPDIAPDVPASRWRLSDAGRLRCHALAERVASYQPGLVVASLEPKAQETGSLLAAHLHAPFETAAGLHEHDRSNVGFLATARFEEAVAAFFERPDELILGRETADQARDRFVRAVDAVIAQHRDGTLAIVAHGTVISLFVAHRSGLAPFPLWKRLDLPSFVVLSLPSFELLETVERVS
jgi:broad specificity phosphatase PhoE